LDMGPGSERRCSLVRTSASAVRLDLPFALSVIDFEYCGASLCGIDLYPKIRSRADIMQVYKAMFDTIPRQDLRWACKSRSVLKGASEVDAANAYGGRHELLSEGGDA
jgi:hypothetical protein